MIYQGKELRDVVGYEGIYYVSEDGEVYSTYCGNGKLRLKKPSIDKDGYLRINLSLNGHSVLMGVHRVVAQAFLDNPNNYPEVEHKDLDRKNNSVSNLSWVSRVQNMQNRSGRQLHFKNCIIQQMKDGQVIAEYKNFSAAARNVIDENTQVRTAVNKISQCCSGIRKTYRGYEWRAVPVKTDAI